MPPSARWILHVDLDAFFASVEELLRPELRGLPLIVGGRPESRGVVAAASYAVRAYGVRSAMPMAQALRLCPQAVVVPPRHGVYGQHSRRVMAILHEYTPVVEQISIDEAFLDLTGTERLWGPVEGVARTIQRRIADECGLPASLGAASSRLVAKIACDLGKPRGLVIVPQGGEAAFLAPLKIDRLWGVGEVTGRRLREHGIDTIGDLASWSEEALAALLGEAGRRLARAARGIDPSEVQDSAARRSISHEETFAADVDDAAYLQETLLWMSESVATTLREGRTVAGVVRLKMRYGDFTTVLRQTTLEQPTDQGQVIYRAAVDLLERTWRPRRPLRLIGVGVSGLLEQGGYQLSLLDDRPLRNARLNRALDEIRERFGPDAIGRASLLRPRPPGRQEGQAREAGQAGEEGQD
jgi:DNA polymerase-4